MDEKKGKKGRKGKERKIKERKREEPFTQGVLSITFCFRRIYFFANSDKGTERRSTFKSLRGKGGEGKGRGKGKGRRVDDVIKIINNDRNGVKAMIERQRQKRKRKRKKKNKLHMFFL